MKTTTYFTTHGDSKSADIFPDYQEFECPRTMADFEPLSSEQEREFMDFLAEEIPVRLVEDLGFDDSQPDFSEICSFCIDALAARTVGSEDEAFWSKEAWAHCRSTEFRNMRESVIKKVARVKHYIDHVSALSDELYALLVESGIVA